MSNTATSVSTTSCEIILRILQRDVKIKGITEILDADLKIELVGDLITTGEVEKLRDLFAEKKLIHYTDGRHCKVPPKNAVRCLRLDYIYLIKDLKRMYS